MNQKLDDPGCLKWLQQEFPIDSRAAWNIQEYLRKQRESTGTIPNDKVVIVEGFRDEIGDPRIVVHSPFGRRINGLLSLVALSRVQQTLNVTPQMLYNDDGVLLRCSDVDKLPLTIFDGITLKEAEEIVLNDLISSPLFSGQFRQNAARALLMPKVAPGKRTPLWLQRLRAGDLLQVARQFDDFPIVIETMREVLNDVLDFNHFKEIISQMESGAIRIEIMETEMPSPFAASMLFDFVAVYMYEWDQPRENRQSQYLSINRELLSEVVDTESIASLLRPEAIETVERQLQRQADGYKARSPEELLEILLRIGDLTDAEIGKRCIDDGEAFIAELASNGRAVQVQLGNTQRWIAGEEESMYETLADEGVVSTIIFRHLQSHGPTTTEEIAERYGLRGEEAERLLTRLSATEQIIRGNFNKSVDQPQWCYRPNLERIHRQTIGILRKEITPASLDDFTHFLLSWQHLYPDRRLTGTAGVQQCLEQLQALPLPSEIWERDVLRSRLNDCSQEILNQASAGGAIVWTGRGSGKMQCVLRGNGNIFIEPPTQETEALFGIAARRVLEYMRKQGASFFADIRAGTQLSLDGLNKGIAELFWAGMITNDLFTELQNVKRFPRIESEVPVERIEILDPRHNPRKAKLMHTVRKALKQVPGWSGRWSLIHLSSVMGDELSIEERSHQQALQLLTRYGIVAREFHRREELLPWALIAAALNRMEMRGEIRRGYFVEGLSGMQFALPLAVEELRRLRQEKNGKSALLLANACDPANPYGPGINLPHNIRLAEELRFARIPANYVVFQRGTPILLIENHGRRLWTLAETTQEILIDALRIFMGVLELPPHLRPVKSITVEHCDGIRPVQSPLEPVLRSLGFARDRNQTMIYEKYV